MANSQSGYCFVKHPANGLESASTSDAESKQKSGSATTTSRTQPSHTTLTRSTTSSSVEAVPRENIGSEDGQVEQSVNCYGNDDLATVDASRIASTTSFCDRFSKAPLTLQGWHEEPLNMLRSAVLSKELLMFLNMNDTFSRISERGPSLLFSDCVDLFNCIRVAQSLGYNGQQLTLKFDIVKCRLARSGKYGGSEQQFETCLKKDDSDKMREILQGLVMSFQTCYKRSYRHFRKLDNDPPEEDASMELDQVLRQLRDHFHTIAMQGLSGAHLIEKTGWTVYNKSHAEILIRDCVSYIDELENDIQFGPEDLEEKARKDIEDVRDVDSLRRLKRLAHGVDSLVEIAAYSKYELLIQDGAAHIGRGSGWDGSSSQLRSGNNFVESIGPGFCGRIQIVDSYGGKGFWD